MMNRKEFEIIMHKFKQVEFIESRLVDLGKRTAIYNFNNKRELEFVIDGWQQELDKLREDLRDNHSIDVTK